MILNIDDSLPKMATILGDSSKFKIITKMPTNDIKSKLNKDQQQEQKHSLSSTHLETQTET